MNTKPNEATVHDKINFRHNAIFYLKLNQYLQLIERDLLSLAPYYFDRLRRQARQVQEAENFKNSFGCTRYEYENNIRR